MTACERQSNGWMFIGSTENDIYLRLRLVSTLDSMGIACLLHQHEAASQEKTGC
jgi:anti-anti-sigma regulatory factor